MKVLFLCTANSCRSQMAEAWGRRLMPPSWDVQSAGLITYPITQETRAVMAEVGLDMAGQKSKTIDEFDLDEFDLVVSLSNEAARFLPVLARPDRHLIRPLSDPMQVVGAPEEVLDVFRATREQIRTLVAAIAATHGSPGIASAGDAPGL